ncbi:MAG: hypothetical protein ACKVWV_07120 [Planctomycetota bacterium]
MPSSTLVYIEAPALGELLAKSATDPLARALAAAPVAASIGAALDEEAHVALAIAREILGGSLSDGLGDLLSGGAAAGLSFKRGTPDWLVVARASDGEKLAATIERAFGAIATKFALGDALSKPAETIAGADIWYLGDKLAIARQDRLLVLAPGEGGIRGVLDRASDENNLALDAAFAAARTHRKQSDLLWAWVNMSGARAWSDKLAGKNHMFKEFDEIARNPIIHAFLGSSIAHATSADSFEVRVCAGRGGAAALELEVRADGVEFAAEPALRDVRPPPLPNRTSECASLLAYRDLAGLYAHRTQLFEPSTLPEIQQGIAGFALFFGGVDFGAEILPRVSPWYALVARAPEFAAGTKPEIEYPAGALLIQLLEPERDGAAFVSAFQSLLAIVNVDLAQKRRPAMRIALEREGETQITVARHAPPKPEDGVDQSYNLAPACALVGGTFVVGTHESVVRSTVRDLVAGRVELQAGSADRLRLDGTQLATFLDKNFDAIALASSLNEGKSIEKARAETRMLRELTASIASLDARLERPTSTSLVLHASFAIARGSEGRRSEPR